jgi:oxygen-dependent protoporphyrinogen oxidase
MADRPLVAVVGGGITGLATAWYLRTGAGPVRPEVVVVEATSRLGGKLRTEEAAGVAVEAGPDTFLARVPWAVDLARELGLADDLIPPATSAALVYHDGRLRPLPRRTVFGVPTTVGGLLAARGLLSGAGTARAALDLVLPRTKLGDDPSVSEVVSRRLGREALDRLVEPLVGGIHAGRADRLSLRSTARPLGDAARHRSLLLGVRAGVAEAGRGERAGPLFLGVNGGMERLVDRLVSSLEGVPLRTGVSVQALVPEGERWRLACAPRPDVVADAVVVAVPAFAATPLLAPVAPDAAKELEQLRYASVVTATLGYRPESVRHPLDASGFLVARAMGGLATACTFSTTKWPDLRRSGLVLLRASAGRDGDDRALTLDDGDLVDRLHRELAPVLGLTAAPVAQRVDRWPRSFPQYEPGHEERVSRAESALVAHPGIFLAGAAYRGLGVAACVQQAETTAGGVMAHLSHRPSRCGGGNMGPDPRNHRQNG